MKLSFTPASILLSCTIALIPTSAFAQSNGGFGNSGDNRDPFSRAASGDTSGLMQIINQAQLNGSAGNTNTDRQGQLNSATVDFRNQQLRLLRDRNKNSASAQPAPVVTPK